MSLLPTGFAYGCRRLKCAAERVVIRASIASSLSLTALFHYWRSSMHPELFFVMVGGIIVAGFLGNLLFKFAKIPSVLLLMAIGILLGPVFNIVQSDMLFDVAPYFGTVALIIILFEGGLDLDIDTVVQQLGKAIFLTFIVFTLTLLITAGVGYFLIGLPLLQSLMLGAIVGGTSPAIIIPIVSKLNVGNHVKTLLSLEPALADVLIIVSVVICIGIFQTQSADPLGIFLHIFQSFTVAIVIAVIMGVVWARFIGSLGGESLSYMLTLGFLFLLYFIVEHFKGSGAIAVLFFGVVLANVSTIAKRVGGPLHKLLGVRVDATKFALDEFVHNITIELSFLVRTFFFVFLGLLFSFNALTPIVGLHIAGIVGACLLARYIGSTIFLRVNKKDFSSAEKIVIHGMGPRGLATAAMAFTPLNAAIPQTDLFPMYALAVIGLMSLSMTAFVGVAERRAGKALMPDSTPPVGEHQQTEEAVGESISGIAPEEPEIPAIAASSTGPALQSELPPVSHEYNTTRQTTSTPNPTIAPDGEEDYPHTFTDRLVHWLHISEFRFRELDHFSVRSTVILDLLYWLQMLGSTAVAVLGIVMNNQVIIFAGMLFAPIAATINTASLALTTGDIYIFLKSVLKFVLTGAAIVSISALVASLVPFAGLPDVVAQRMQPTVLDFALAAIMGVLLPITILRGRSLEIFAIAPLVAFLVVPSLAIVGYGIGSDSSATMQIISGGLLSFSANITALLISSILTLLTLGMTKHRATEFVEEWKQRELSNGIMRALLARKGFSRLLRTAGTIHARLIVLTIFALVLFIPLVTSINELAQRYNVRQTVTRYSKLFEQKNRSSILSVDVEFNKKQVDAQIRVATNTLFTEADIKRFETAVEKSVGLPTDLTLVQSYGDVGAAKPLASLGSTSRKVPESFQARISSIAAEAQQAVTSIPALSGVTILGTSIQFYNGISPQVAVEYMAPEAVDDNLALLIRNTVATLLKMPDNAVTTSWIPASYSGDTPDISSMTGPGGRFSAAEILRRYEGLSGTVFVPKRVRRDSLTDVVAKFRTQEESLADTNRFRYVHGEGGHFAIRFEK